MDGFFYGVIYDGNDEQIIKNARVSSSNNNLSIVMPANGLYFLSGASGDYTISISAPNYQSTMLQLKIIGGLQRRDIYLKNEPHH